MSTPKFVLFVSLLLVALVGCSDDPAADKDASSVDASANDGTGDSASTDAAGDVGDGTGDATADGSGVADVFVPDPATWAKDKVRAKESKPAGKGPLSAGVAVRFIDGPVGVSMAGYGGRFDGRQSHWSDVLKGSAGFYGLQAVKAMVLEAGGEKLALVKSPLMSSESYLTDAIARQLKQAHGKDFDGRVITMAGHSHHTTARYWPLPPSLGSVGADSFDTEVAERAAAVFAAAIAAADDARKPAEWAWAAQDDWDPKDEVYRDRRGENDPTYGKDPRLLLLAVRDKASGAPLASVIHFPIHGTVFGDDNDMLTEDAPGYVEHKFEDHFFAQTGKPIVGMLAQSAGGDASPAGDSLGHPSLARLERLGEAAAPKIFALYQTLQWQAEAELAVRSQRVELKWERLYAGKPYEKEFENAVGPYIWGAWQCKAASDSAGPSMQGKLKLCVDVGKLVEILGAPVPNEAAHQAYLTSARIGDLWMLTMPGEPNWSIVKWARDQAASRTWNGKPMNLAVIGYAQDHYLYLSAPDDWYLGGYESEMSLWGPAGGVFFAGMGLELIDEMAAGFNGPALAEESPSLLQPAPFSPRAFERAKAPGTVAEQPAASVGRTQTARFSADCGDPAHGPPHLVLQRKDDKGAFVDVPATHGQQGAAYDNRRYEMVSAYVPDPPQEQHESVSVRQHRWHFFWQVPAGWPTGEHRFRLRCTAIAEGAASDVPAEVEVDSQPFAVGPAEGVTVTVDGAVTSGASVGLAMRVPGVPQQMETSPVGKGKWAASGYRLLDRDTKHQALALVRVPLKVELLDAGGAVLATIDAAFDAATQRNVVAVPGSLSATVVQLRVWVAADAVPAKVSVAL